MKKFLVKQISIIVSIILLFSTVTFATSEPKIEKMPQKSESFLKWENMSAEERKNTIQPSYLDINLKDSIKRSTYNQYLGASEELPTSYSLVEELKDTSEIFIKNQRETSSCWAFSYSSVIETTIANKYQRPVLEYSPMHIDYKVSTIFNNRIGTGGNFYLAEAYGVSGLGPVYENDFEFEDVYDEVTIAQKPHLKDISTVELNQESRARIKDTVTFAPIYKNYSTDSITYKDSSAFIGANTYTNDEVEAIRKLVKTHIMENGAITATLYTNNGNIQSMYNSEKKAYYNDLSIYTPDHAVTIVGWDDTFSKDNFLDGNKPINDGAYIVLNSWGSEFGNNGYFYVSYDDSCIEQALAGITEIVEKEVEGQIFYDKLYEYDELGKSMLIPNMNDSGIGYAANVFARQQIEGYEYLSEVGIYLLNAHGVEVYVNSENEDINNCTLVASYTGNKALEAGYHTLELSSPIRLTGNKFVVKIKYINSEMASMPIECDLYESGLSTASTYYDTATSNKGESYISYDGTTWSDLYDYQLNYGSESYILKDANACIKAFTTYSEGEEPSTVAVTGVTLDKETVTIKEGQTASLVATVLPDNATNQNITWTISDEAIATIENGVITAVAEGTATITVTTEEGNFTDTCVVTVEKTETEPETITVTGVTLDKETVTIKEGQTARLVATVLPENATNKNIIWTSNEETIATVENGVITGVAEGTATITVKTLDGNFTDTCIITVEKEEIIIDVSGVKLDKNSIEMQVGEKVNVVATIQPINATIKEVIWASSNENVVKISETGIIEALKEGKSTITVTTKDGKFTASCEITVSAKVNTDDDIYTENEQQPGKTEQVGDSTTVKGEIPKAGTKTFILLLGILMIVTIVVYVKNKKYEDIR